MSERMIEIKRDIEKKRRHKKHAKEIVVFMSEFCGIISIFGIMYILSIFFHIVDGII